ncbi:Uncharacterised protein [Klebsiella pneumoniae]|nr:Uncharacterised protein [Klebsiella pneumoniae]
MFPDGHSHSECMVQTTALLLLSGKHSEGRSIRRGMLSGFRCSFMCKMLTVPAKNEFIAWLAFNQRSSHNNGVITLIVKPDA